MQVSTTKFLVRSYITIPYQEDSANTGSDPPYQASGILQKSGVSPTEPATSLTKYETYKWQ
jgi:hypothetical protein